MQENVREAERRIMEARRTQAEILDLGDLALSELPASLGDLPGLRALYLGIVRPNEDGDLVWDGDREFPKFADLSPLVRLKELEYLTLSVTEGTDLAPLTRLQALRCLALTESPVTNLTSLAQLRSLQRLDLWNCAQVIDLTPLAQLGALQSLDLHNCTGVTNLSPLAGLRELRFLNLSLCRGVTDFSPLTELHQLQALSLARTNLMDLTMLSGLQRIQSLNLSEMSLTSLVPLARLRALQSLDLSFCHGITDLTPLAQLPELQYLSILSTDVVDLAPLHELRTLEGLNLSDTFTMDLAPLARLRSLQRLFFSATGVTDLAPLTKLQNIRILDLSFTNVRNITPLADLQKLEELYLYRCRSVAGTLDQIMAIYPRLIRLIVDELAGVPREILSHNEIDNCLPRLRAYLAELDRGAAAENEVKVILLGNGRVGKTQLCRRFRGEPFDRSVPSTHGVQIWREELRLSDGGEEKTFQVNWWDFGGQDIYHGTHALFLRSQAVFLILWTPELENREETEENGIPLRNQPLAYWLNYVRSLAGAGSPVIVVQSQCDRFSDQRPAPPIPAGLGFVQSCFYSAKEDLGREVLEGQLRNAIGYLVEQNGKIQIGRGRAEVRRRLYAWRMADQQREPAERQHRTLTLDQFRALCDEVGDIVSQEAALDYFHQTGVVFYDRRLFDNCIVLDQTWALDAVYTVFHRAQVAPFLWDSGRFTRKHLDFLAWPDHSVEEQKLFLGLMESCGVCFSIGKTVQGETRYIAPELLPPFEAVAGRVHLTWKPEAETTTLRLEYRFFHLALLRCLMREIGWQAGDLAEYWKYGFWLKDGKRDTQLLVQFFDTSTAETPGAGALVLKAQGGDPTGLLREIRKAIRRQRIGEKPEELLTLGGTTVARSSLSTRTNNGRAQDTAGTWVPAEAFAAFFEGRDHRPAEASTAEQPLAIAARPLRQGEKPREVYISYAWGDDKTARGKRRAQVVDALQEALEKEGSFQPIRDRDKINTGDRISRFMIRLTRGDLIVTVVSDKYLRSWACMYEIYKLWQRHQGDPDELIRHLVPIVLPEVKIGGFEQRARYLALWSERADKLEALIRNPKLKPGRESWEEVRLIREFSHHIDDILVFLQDVLMPRQLEAHLDHGFEPVLSALRRKIEA